MYLDAVGEERPELRPAAVSWSRIDDPTTLTQVFLDAGTPPPTIIHETLVHPITADDFWTIVLGSGYRVLIDVMGPKAADRVRIAIKRRMKQDQVEELTADIMYARVTKNLVETSASVVVQAECPEKSGS
jgi:hypothetical protein